MKFIFLFMSAITLPCYAASETMETHYCYLVKNAAKGVMDARQHDVPVIELQEIASHLEEAEVKELYQQIIDTAYSSKLFEDPLTKTKAVEDFQMIWHEKCLAKSSIS
ncbi:hypothetical protein RJC92_04060 [Acinetobacter nosocomialis]|uniref:hypothetical protein n=1 Tax=Acinetobacter nosocomialis TaxID=106654 RepID=UPI0028706E00|nr:hypothetical protein [Acinetobacter nosocomialis]MDR9576564.1 hypothetical protein [Acinetobacter nosocomialis]